MRRSFVHILAVAVASLVGGASVSSACSCAQIDFYTAYHQSDAIFLGEVMDVRSAAPERPTEVLVMVRVENRWKGEPTAIDWLLTPASGASCGYSFVPGGRYLVYANARNDTLAPGILWTHLCTRTHATHANDPDVDLLESGPPQPPPLVVTLNPNPSRGLTQISWTIPTPAGLPLWGRVDVRIDVLDFQGRHVARIVDGPIPSGFRQAVWDGRDVQGRLVPAGIYCVRLAYGGQVTSRKLVRIAGGP